MNNNNNNTNNTNTNNSTTSMMNTSTRTGSSSSSMNEMISTIRNECDNIRRSITCPICLCTMIQPIITLAGCSHSFCYTCIYESYNTTTTTATAKDDKKRKSQQQPKCPLCSLPYQRRSLQQQCDISNDTSHSNSSIISNTTILYKQLMQSFGMIPIQYTPTITTCTQVVVAAVDEDSYYDNSSCNSSCSESECSNGSDNEYGSSSAQKKSINKNKAKQQLQDIQDQYEMSKYMYHTLYQLYHDNNNNNNNSNNDKESNDNNNDNNTTNTNTITILQLQEQEQIMISNQIYYNQQLRKYQNKYMHDDNKNNNNIKQKKQKNNTNTNSNNKSTSASKSKRLLTKGITAVTGIETPKAVTVQVTDPLLLQPHNTITTTTKKKNSSSINNITSTTTPSWTQIVQIAQSQEVANGYLEDDDDDDDDDVVMDHKDIVMNKKTDEIHNDDDDDDDDDNGPIFHSAIEMIEDDPILSQSTTTSTNKTTTTALTSSTTTTGGGNWTKYRRKQQSDGTIPKQEQENIGTTTDPNNNDLLVEDNVDTTSVYPSPTIQNIIPTKNSNLNNHLDKDTDDTDNDGDDSIPGPSHIPPPKNNSQRRSNSMVTDILFQQEQLSPKEEDSNENDENIEPIITVQEHAHDHDHVTTKSMNTSVSDSAIVEVFNSKTTSENNTDTTTTITTRAVESNCKMILESSSSAAAAAAVPASRYQIGDIVQVQARTGPGMNQLGGIAEIMNVHYHINNNNNNVTKHHHRDYNQGIVTYDVRYVLNRRQREFDLDACYISSPEYDITKNSSIEETNHPNMTTITSSTTTRIKRTRKSCSNIPNMILPSPLRAALLADGCDVDGIATRKALSQFNNTNSNSNNKQQSVLSNVHGKENSINANVVQDRKKQIVAPVNRKRKDLKQLSFSSQSTNMIVPPTSYTIKRQKLIPKVANDDDSNHHHDNKISIALPSTSWTIPMKCQMADEMYRDRIHSAIQKGTIYICTSLLSIIEQEQIHLLCRIVHKNKKLKIKITDTVEPKRTTLCILPTIMQTTVDGESNIAAERRSMKSMFASLDGIPMVSSTWIDQCIQQKKLIIPEPNMFVRTLPTKTSISSQISEFGVAHLAANIYNSKQQVPSSSYLPLQQVQATYMVGFDVKTNDTSNFTSLLRRAGVTDVIVNSSIATTKLKSFISTKENAMDRQSTLTKYFIVLCNSDIKMLSFDDTFVRTIQELQQTKKRQVMVVDIQWLFDSITCGTLLKADTSVKKADVDMNARVYCYQPVDSKAQELWQLTTTTT